MRWHKHFLIAALVAVVTVMTAAALGATRGAYAQSAHQVQKADELEIDLTPSSAALAACMQGASLTAKVRLTTEERGFDRFDITARHLPPNREYTIFLLQQATSPFGAAEYIGDFSTDFHGDAKTKLRLIVGEAFSSTIVNGARVRADLNRIGVWFADPLDDDFCLGAGSPVTPFDGDNEAGVQVFNSADADALPAP